MKQSIALLLASFFASAQCFKMMGRSMVNSQRSTQLNMAGDSGSKKKVIGLFFSYMVGLNVSRLLLLVWVL